MINAIPFFYADLIARMIPGAISLALLGLTTFEPLHPWAEFNMMSGMAIILPVFYAGQAYVIGTILEVLLSRPLEILYICAFNNASKTYSWTYEGPQNMQKVKKSAKELSRASFGYLIAAISKKESEIISHIVRFHSEAKMCFSVLCLFLVFLLAIIVQKSSDVSIIRPISNNIAWLFILILAIFALFYGTLQRLASRSRFILRGIERLADEEESSENNHKSSSLMELRDQLYTFSNN
ncbi:MAG: hypothetical protein NTY36_08315 [Deltaproteobacteria bacterium]|nr:hypothetical protein [Deltaproteobacteria bacterium]